MKSYMYMIVIPLALLVLSVIAMSFKTLSNKDNVSQNREVTQVSR